MQNMKAVDNKHKPWPNEIATTKYKQMKDPEEESENPELP